ncbi:hypothetical protein ABZY20_06355 [Streptomyces sp. NPDC006624]|uniref:hypothetical protein n=1 Tax=unclassified Streptomyces TaxID=2593676 RepID=UPI0033B2FF07
MSSTVVTPTSSTAPVEPRRTRTAAGPPSAEAPERTGIPYGAVRGPMEQTQRRVAHALRC